MTGEVVLKKQDIRIHARFGRLKVVCRHTPLPADRHRYYLCVCKCGQWRRISGSALRTRNTTSCGCLRLERVNRANRRRRTHGKTGTRLYRIWHGMIQRCHYSKHEAYAEYGGRGIHVDMAWHFFYPFYQWAKANGYKGHLTLDRKNNDKGYNSENCRWVTWKVQRANQRKNPRGEWSVT